MEPVPPPPAASADRLDVKEPRRIRLVRRCRQPLRRVDLVMLVAAVLSWFAWMVGLRFVEGAMLLAVWIGLWIWWRRRRANALVATVCIAVLIAMLWGPRWHGAFEVARDCLTDRATDQLSAVPTDFDRDDADRRAGGRCGLVRYGASVTAQGFLDDPYYVNGEPRITITAVWFTDAGPPVLDLFGGGAYVYSPEGVPGCATRAVGDTHGCDDTPIGDDWYYVIYNSNIN